MRSAAEEAYQVQLHTGDSQLMCVILDKAALDIIYAAGKASENQLISDYVEIKVAVSDINIAVRGLKTGKKREFLERAIAECKSIDKNQLIEAALSGETAIYNYLRKTAYSDSVQAIKESPSAFERWCDNLIIKNIKPQKYNPFTLAPLAAYILARENEIKSVRILLSGKLNDLPEESVRERLRDMYV